MPRLEHLYLKVTILPGNKTFKLEPISRNFLEKGYTELNFETVKIKTNTIQKMKFTVKDRVLFGRNKPILKGQAVISDIADYESYQNLLLVPANAKLGSCLKLYRGGIRFAAMYRKQKKSLEFIVQSCFNLPIWVRNPRLSCIIKPYKQKSTQLSPPCKLPSATSPEFGHCFEFSKMPDDFMGETTVTVKVIETGLIHLRGAAERIIGTVTIGISGNNKSVEFWNRIVKAPEKYHYQTFNLTN